MKRRNFLFIALAVIIVLMWALIYLPKKKSFDEKKSAEKMVAGEKNVAEVFNQGENVVVYNGYTFIVDKTTNSIIRYSEKDDVGSRVVYTASGSIGNQLFIMGNRLIFTVGEDTYSSDLDGKNSKKITDGNIVYMDNDVFVYILQDVTAQYVCITSYNNKNLEKTSDMIFNIAKGNEITYLKRDDRILFFNSYNTNGTTTLFSVDLDKSQSKVLINTSTENDIERYEYVDVVKIGNILYSLQATYQLSTDYETYSTNTLYRTYIDTIITTWAEQGLKPSNRIFADKEKLFTKVYNEDIEQYEWVSVSLDESDDFVTQKAGVLDESSKEYWTNILHGDLTDLFILDDRNLKMDGLAFATLDDDYKNFSLKYVWFFSNKIYVLINQNGKSVWFSFNDDGSNMKKVFEYNI